MIAGNIRIIWSSCLLHNDPYSSVRSIHLPTAVVVPGMMQVASAPVQPLCYEYIVILMSMPSPPPAWKYIDGRRPASITLAPVTDASVFSSSQILLLRL